MSKKEAKVTISRRNHGTVCSIHIQIGDHVNYNNIIEVSMTPEAFAEALTNVANVPADIIREPTLHAIEHLGQSREVIRVQCDKVKNVDFRDIKTAQKKAVKDHFEKHYGWTEWQIKDYGLNSRQDGKQHTYVIFKYLTDES